MVSEEKEARPTGSPGEAMHFLPRHDPVQIPISSNHILGPELSGTHRVPAWRPVPEPLVFLCSLDMRMGSDPSLHNPETPGHVLDCSFHLKDPSFFSGVHGGSMWPLPAVLLLLDSEDPMLPAPSATTALGQVPEGPAWT